MSKYAGESIAKKVARVRLYRRVREALRWRGISPDKITAIFLPGPQAHEVGALKFILGLPPQQVLAVDRDSESCAMAEHRWPGIRTLNSDLGNLETWEAAVKWGGLGLPGAKAHFVHMDLMGNLGRSAEQVYFHWCQKVEVNGVFAVTYLRGREAPNSRAAQYKTQSKEALAECGPRSSRAGKTLLRILAADPERALSHFSVISGHVERVMEQRQIIEALAPGEQVRTDLTPMMAVPIGTYCYRSEQSPMGVLITQFLDTRTSPEAVRMFLAQRGRHVSSVLAKDPIPELVAEADSLRKEFSAPQVLEILDIERGTLNAYRAHTSRGTYE